MGPRPGLISTAFVAAFIMLGGGAAWAHPGHPGTPDAPAPIFIEGFENQSGAWQPVTGYVSAAGFGYAASLYWAELAGNCNGLIAQNVFPSPPATGCSNYDDANGQMRPVPEALAAVVSGVTSTANHALIWLSAGTSAVAPGEPLLDSSVGLATAAGHYVRLGFDAAGFHCADAGTSPPLLTGSLTDGTTESSAFSTQVNPCTQNSAEYLGVRVGRYRGDIAHLTTGGTLGFVIREWSGTEIGNDGGLDNVRIENVTPQMDLSLTAPTTPGGTGTLRVTVTNRSDLLAKNGWSFRLELPTGMTVDGSPTSSCGGTLGADQGWTAVSMNDGALAAGSEFCTTAVPVAGAPGATYSLGATDVAAVGLMKPGSASASWPEAIGPQPPPTPPPPVPPPFVDPIIEPIDPVIVIVPAVIEEEDSFLPDPEPDDRKKPVENDILLELIEGLSDEGGVPDFVDAGERERGAGSPSVFTGKLPTIWEVIKDPEKMAAAVAMGLVWTLLLIMATSALENAVGARIDDWSAFLVEKLPGGKALAAKLGFLVSHSWWAIGGLMLVHATILSLVDPHFGPDLLSLRSLGSVVVASILTVIIPLHIVARLARRRWGHTLVFTTSPWGLAVGMIGVAVSRLIGFLPGLLGGTTMDVEHEDATEKAEARVTRAKLLLTLGFAGMCLVGASRVPDSGSWQALFLHDSFVAGAIIAIFGPFVDLIPVSFFSGAQVWRHYPKSWIALMTGTAAAFALVVLPEPSYWLYVGERAEWWIKVSTAIILLALLAVVVVAKLEDRAKRGKTREAIG